MRRLAVAWLGLAAVATFLASCWVLWQSPFAAPYRDRTEAELRVALDAALTRDLTAEAVRAKIQTALDAGAADEAVAVLRLADGRGVKVSDATRNKITTAQEAAKGWSACLACAINPDDCPDLTRVAACNLPLELTPIGDGKAVYRALRAYVEGAPVDRFDLALGVVGLAATAAILTSGGTSLTVKTGATALRIARRTGAMTGTLADEIAGLAAAGLRLDRSSDVMHRLAGFDALIDPVATARLTAVASDMGRLTGNMSFGDAFGVLRYADNTDELTRVARVAGTMGSETRGTFAVLGKARVVRLTSRLTGLVLVTIALLAALAGQLLALLLWRIRRKLRGVGRRSKLQTRHKRGLVR